MANFLTEVRQLTSKQSSKPTHATQPELVPVQQLFNGAQVGPKREMDCDFGKVTQILGVCLRISPRKISSQPTNPRGSRQRERVL